MQQKRDVRAVAAWRKSSYSNGEGAECVEVADGLPVVPVRDSKCAEGAVLAFGPVAWSGFVTAIKHGGPTT
ncbi:DUF397 domain-containing protein [Streptomyces marincola]|uniref:DUF397 domain-containing protein n=1 Tax=Streptomyces marincola TaxID=2878388 RepID=A0A1W7D014_9ACTN|nr:DUF397 domain-containing protein [Streptomyces marincola]ARQ70362.1 DUF397 domain-containing protein [Streptomyces marincola]